MTETTKRRHKRLPPKQMWYRKSLLIEQYGMKCFWCECDLTAETLTIDHYIPLSRGGSNKPKNLRIACKACNNKRGNTMPEETVKTIHIPGHWNTPKYKFGQLVKHGRIIGLEYRPPETKRGYELKEKWIYSVLMNDEYEVECFSESSIEPASPEDLKEEIAYQKNLTDIRQKNLAAFQEQLQETT